MPSKRLPVRKTYKLFVGGKFVRSESGRVAAAVAPNGDLLANYSRASRKDLRDAVSAARSGLETWRKTTAYLRGQILYRAAEMLEARRGELENELVHLSRAKATREVTAAIDALVYFAGWTDKFSQILGSVNPVATSHFNFTFPEPTGIVAALAPDEPALLGFASLLAPIIASGNAVVAVASSRHPLAALTFGEIIATSDLPSGVVNILAGERADLVPHLASHMEINAIVNASGEFERELQSGSAINVKRYFSRPFRPDFENPYAILDTVELKTAWHPIGL